MNWWTWQPGSTKGCEGEGPTLACIVGNLVTMLCNAQQKTKLVSRGEVIGERHSSSSLPSNLDPCSCHTHNKFAAPRRLRPRGLGGADGNFMAASLVAELHLTLTRLQMPLLEKALNGLQLAQITHVTFPVSLLISGNHQETIVSHILDSPEVPIVLGHPWLVKHNPHIDWSNHNILGWRCPCL